VKLTAYFMIVNLVNNISLRPYHKVSSQKVREDKREQHGPLATGKEDIAELFEKLRYKLSTYRN
jgi:hypothetical protein